ncbi:hypothetical protein G4G28_06575 [Massilia sp. Dwa41.01b]|uniref:hypothetical protein n=1 Tax=unclassified Massilia TaxID=2609279 RepID=UPI0016045737|nr:MULTISPECIES: hypothetical protein [unclassified Massilia]QNA88251.1 hypothetical protein G4G28_06575 [Massilia sp. Dwa41.01b]QNA99151.1 hypothetical protein G4G31_10300 [Massilia sp. Se16.2.3]
MTPTLRPLATLALAITASFASTTSFATETGNTTAPAIIVAPPPLGLSIPRFATKSPLPLSIDFRSKKDEQMDELRIVRRASVVGANVTNVAVGVTLAVLGASSAINGRTKDDFYGDEIKDEQDTRKLASPFRVGLPTLLDQKIVDLFDDDSEDAAKPSYKNTLSITPIAWNLVYHELNADKEHEDDYVLRFAARFTKVIEGEEDRFMHKARSVERGCEYVSKPQSLASWQQNDYEAVAEAQKVATQACIDQVAPFLPAFLGIDSNTKIRAAQLNCKNTFKQCVAGTDGAAEPGAAKKLCKEEYSQCVRDDVKPMISMTPIGQCKDTFAACKATVIDKARALNPNEKPAKSEFVPCATEYKTCVAAAR